MRRTYLKTLALGAAFVGFASLSPAQWVAYNDHVPSSGTSPNATTNNIRLGTTGPLKNIATGASLSPVNLAITKSGTGITYTISGASPVAGTPLYNTFNTFVSFAAATDSNVELTNSTVTYTFTGLNAAKKYSFRGGAVRGLAAATNRWTKVTIGNATGSINAHSANVLTSAQAANDLTANDAAVNFGVNNTAATGDQVGWDNITPVGGSFTITCAQYQGFVPNGGKSNGTNGYAITGIRLEEVYLGPPIITVQPVNQTVNAGSTATFSVTAIGTPPLQYQWFRDGSMIPGATSSTYTTPVTSINDFGAQFHVMVHNGLNPAVTSQDATLVVIVQPVTVMELTNTWKYNQNGTSLGTTWRSTTYDDSAWPSGHGVLAYETDNQTVLPLTNTVLTITNAQNGFVTTYYFRTHFNLPYDPTSITLTASNLIDDGAVFYLNGQEVYRQNIISKPNPVVYSTLASGAGEAAWTSVVLPDSVLVQGDNVLAVEVHQGSIGSSDIVWGMSIRGDVPPPTPLTITGNPPPPADRAISAGASTTFTVTYSGSQPSFQWYKWVNDAAVPIAGATKPSYTITNAAVSDSGYYFATVTNVLSSLVTRSALLTVSTDGAGPRLILADGSDATTNVTVSFSEFVSAITATNIANYKITNVNAGGTLTITKAVLDSGTNVILTTSTPRANNINYLLIVNNVADTSPSANRIIPNSSIPISSLVTIIGMEQGGWDYYDPVLGPPISPYYPGAGWNDVGFSFGDPSSDQWGHGAAGLFVYDQSDNPLPGTINTALSQGATTKYFRYPFNFSPSPGATLKFRHIVDDGIIAYLNGHEVYRFNMPAGAINELTAASVTVGVAVSSDYIDLPSNLLHSGSNVFAVELHGTSPTDLDWVFGAELLGGVSSFSTGPVIITGGPSDTTVEEGQTLNVGFLGVGAASFQWRTNGTAIPGATNSILTIPLVPANWNGKLVSVVASSPTSASVTSTNARITVTPDNTSPALVSAFLATPTTVSVNFSEAITLLTATNLANYKVTNSTGGTLTVTGATFSNGTNVVLSFGSIPPAAYTLVVNNIKDVSGAANIIAANSRATIGFTVSFPFSAVWRFYTNNINLGTTWSTLAFNDTVSPWSSGPALIADETTPPLEPILTPISRLDNGVYHYTFYFRYHLTAPMAAKSGVFTFRHIIDDGAIFYFNGVEFHRFNMAAGAVDWMTQANTNATEGVYDGPYTATVSNILAGDNVIAVEVHQNGTGSSDITFGAEMSLTADSTIGGPSGGPVGAPTLQIAKAQGTNVVVSWAGKGFTLEKKTVLSPATFWAPATNQSPYTVTPKASTNQFQSYRLRN